MGYEVHITRAQHWTDSESDPITIHEWLALITADPEMRLDNFAEAVIGEDTLRYDNDGLAVWTAYSRHGQEGNMAWFDYRRGAVIVKNPDAEILGKMRVIAAALHANVIGDEGESYDL